MGGRLLARIGLVLGLAALLIQFSITIPESMETGRGFFASLVFYFSFFTILTNIYVVLVYVAYLRGKPEFFTRPPVRACAATSIALVMIVYATMLAGLYAPRGWFLTADILLHYICPPVFVLWWAIFAADGTVKLRDLAPWLTYPLLYFLLICVRWIIVDEMPYPFIDPGNGGWAHVGKGVLTMSIFFFLISLMFIVADRAIARLRR
ncbi:hypothetical protein GCM10010136_00820 [Limoniibacter endophyticus]|uniref:FAR-17a/AIG1-like protein n=2 Tax=Limoniibacter endophyticus TaxID=1565040 RepID=A0A8J3DLJ7_9HYPH|nr:hypothetical protein GCM10010136_00820 [Limoniibacter endophyticus]